MVGTRYTLQPTRNEERLGWLVSALFLVVSVRTRLTTLRESSGQTDQNQSLFQSRDSRYRKAQSANAKPDRTARSSERRGASHRHRPPPRTRHLPAPRGPRASRHGPRPNVRSTSGARISRRRNFIYPSPDATDDPTGSRRSRLELQLDRGAPEAQAGPDQERGLETGRQSGTPDNTPKVCASCRLGSSPVWCPSLAHFAE